MTTTVHKDILQQVQDRIDARDTLGAWSILAEAGDPYAIAAKDIVDPSLSDSFTKNMVKSAWQRAMGDDAYEQHFDAVALKHVEGYLGVINRNIDKSNNDFIELPNTEQIEISYENAL